MTILFLNLEITRSDIMPHIKWAVSLVIAYGHFNLPQGFVWVCTSLLTLSTPRGPLELDLILVVLSPLELIRSLHKRQLCIFDMLVSERVRKKIETRYINS